MEKQPGTEDLDFTKTLEGNVDGGKLIREEYESKIASAKKGFDLAIQLGDADRAGDLNEKRQQFEAEYARLDISKEMNVSVEDLKNMDDDALKNFLKEVNIKTLALEEYQHNIKAENPVELAKYAEVGKRLSSIKQKKEEIETALRNKAEEERAANIYEKAAIQK